jgi:hypothetical protein
MRNLLAFLAAGALAVAGLGWYLGWYHVHATPTSDGHEKISIDVDQKKIAADVKQGVQQGTQKVEDYLKKDGHTPTGSTHSDVHPDRPAGVSNNFRYNSDGSIEYTGEISTPVPHK